jgi:hypothetical protein
MNRQPQNVKRISSTPPPHNLEAEAEQATLGAVLVRPETMPQVAVILDKADFLFEPHKKIYKAMLDLYEAGKAIDTVTINMALQERGQLKDVGGAPFLAGLYRETGFVSNAVEYANRVKEKSIIRKLQAKAQEIAKRCQQPIDNLADFLQLAESEIYEITQSNNNGHGRRVISAKAMLDRTYAKEEQIIGRGVLPKGGGLIIAGESGEGKSLIRTQLAVHLAMGWDIWELPISTARRVFIFTFENPESTEAWRLKKMVGGLGITNLPDRVSFSDPTTRIDLGLKGDRGRALEIVKEAGADVVIYDPLTSLHSVNENDNVQVRKVLDTITEINRKTGTTAIVIHHFGKPQEGLTTAHRTRGASSIRDWADTLIAITRKKHESRILRLLEFIKVRNGPEIKPILLERDEYFLHSITEDDMLCPPEQVKELLESLGGRIEGQEKLKKAIIERFDCGDRSAVNFIGNALDRGLIKSDKHPTNKRMKIYHV